ncbi:glycosyltransferase [Romboutsia sp.]|uniref:glycosyltransferase n=1 Tax=Romboutsia sp. TaxID=1965302 RepID=UPI003F4194C2
MKNALVVVNLAGFLCFLWNDLKLLKDMGYEVSVACDGKLSDGNIAREIKILENEGIEFHQVDFDTKNPFNSKNINAYRQINKILDETRYDVIHCHTPIAGILTRLASIKYRKKGSTIMYTSHGFAFTDKTSKKSWFIYFNIEKIMSRFTDAIITINNEDYLNAKKMNCNRVFYIPGVGVETKKYRDIFIDRDEYRKSIGIDKNSIMILSVGELSQRKNHKVVIEAIGMLKNKEKYSYVICGKEVGHSGIKELLIETAKKYNVNLILLGHRSDIPQITKCADISIIPSTREGLGLAGIESLSANIPIIGSDVQGIRDYIQDGINGYLCDPYSAKEFSIAIQKLEDLEFRKKIAKKGFESIQQYDIEESKKSMKEIYMKYII